MYKPHFLLKEIYQTFNMVVQSEHLPTDVFLYSDNNGQQACTIPIHV